ncbi:MAG: efflux transporter outer membrane subunit [Nevskia sp.]|nr:efflux transporter outer membrane subunit [Nevskia sp.]MDR3672892.1 efflux transporter outer membrane subunit [Holophaga sp.]
MTSQPTTLAEPAAALRSRVPRSALPWAAVAALGLGLLGCNPAPKYTVPTLPGKPPVAYKENQSGSAQAQANGWKQADPKDAMLRGKWWKVFGDPQLDALEEQLVIGNQNIKQYFANYMAARALVRNAHASLFPSVTLAPSASNQGHGPSAATTSGSGQSYELPLNVSWEPDLFGKISNSVRADAHAAQVSAANIANETLSEQSSLAQYYFELRGQDAMQELYRRQIASYGETLRLTQVLYQNGIDSEQDVAQAESNLRTAEANAVAIGTTRAQYEHAIALLVGEAAGKFSLPVQPLKATPPYIPAGLPSQLLERRPDIAAAERTVAEANALIGVGKAAYYPTISLTASAGTASSDLSRLLGYGARFWSIGASASETLLDFGANKANVQRYEAQYDADAASYRQTVLNAFKEVEDYLVASRQLAEQEARQHLAVQAALRYEVLAEVRYRTGLDAFLNVLTAQNSALASQQTLVTLQTNRMTTAVQLIAALGGGWNAADLPSEKEVAAKP